jgi:hypothetical protein
MEEKKTPKEEQPKAGYYPIMKGEKPPRTVEIRPGLTLTVTGYDPETGRATQDPTLEEDLKPLNMYDSQKLLDRAKLLHADMIQHVAEDDQDLGRIEAAFAELYKFLGGER